MKPLKVLTNIILTNIISSHKKYRFYALHKQVPSTVVCYIDNVGHTVNTSKWTVLTVSEELKTQGNSYA